MTAKDAGKHAVTGVWLTLRRLRDHWVLLAFVATALFWLRDTYDEIKTFPDRATRLEAAVVELSEEVSRVTKVLDKKVADQREVVGFPGLLHSVTDGASGERVLVRFRPVVPHRSDCRPVTLAAFMIDASGQWFSVDADMAEWPRLSMTQELAFGVEVHPKMASGRAQLLLQVVHLCGDRVQVDTSPRLPFRVLP